MKLSIAPVNPYGPAAMHVMVAQICGEQGAKHKA